MGLRSALMMIGMLAGAAAAQGALPAQEVGAWTAAWDAAFAAADVVGISSLLGRVAEHRDGATVLGEEDAAVVGRVLDVYRAEVEARARVYNQAAYEYLAQQPEYLNAAWPLEKKLDLPPESEFGQEFADELGAAAESTFDTRIYWHVWLAMVPSSHWVAYLGRVRPETSLVLLVDGAAAWRVDGAPHAVHFVRLASGATIKPGNLLTVIGEIARQHAPLAASKRGEIIAAAVKFGTFYRKGGDYSRATGRYAEGLDYACRMAALDVLDCVGTPQDAALVDALAADPPGAPAPMQRTQTESRPSVQDRASAVRAAIASRP